MTYPYKQIFNFQILFPIVCTLIAIGFKVAHILSVPWFLIFVPAMISVPVGLFLIAFIFIFTLLLTERD